MDREKIEKARKERVLEPSKSVGERFVAGEPPVEIEELGDEPPRPTEEASRWERIRDRAYAIWLDQGQGHGRDEEHWRQAEQEIDREGERGGAK